MTTTFDRTAPRDLAAELPARLSLTPKTTLAGQLDGAWWPRSRDLEAELPALAAALDETWGRIRLPWTGVCCMWAGSPNRTPTS